MQVLARYIAFIFVGCLLATSATLAAQEGGPYTCPPCSDGPPAPNPEPVSMSLLGLGGLCLVYSLRRRREIKDALIPRG